MKKIGLKLALLLTGFIIVALPDPDTRLISISTNHGPSLLDALGLTILLVAYVWLLMDLWNRRDKVIKYRHTGLFQLSLFILGLGYGLIIASVMNQYQTWWIYGIALSVATHIIIFYFAFKST